jgi:ATP-binding cassette subfamily B protein
LGCVFLFLVNAIAAYIPMKIRDAINLLEYKNEFNLLNYTLLVILLLAIVMAIFRIYSRQIIFRLGRQAEFDLKKTIFNHLVKQEMNYFSKQRTGDLISIISNDVQSIRALAGFAMLNILNTLIAFAFTLPRMFALNIPLTWAFLCLVPLVILSVVVLSDKIKFYQELVQQKLGEMSNFIEQNISGMAIVKSFAQEDNEVNRFNIENNSLRIEYLKLVAIRSVSGPVMRSIASFGSILVLYFGGKGVIESSFDLGDFAAYTLFVQNLIWPVASFGWLVTVVYRAQVSQKRIKKILEREPEIRDLVGAIEKRTFDSKIQFNHLGKDIKKSETIAIVGTIASGKSFFANQLMRMFEVEDNQIVIDGICIRKIKLDSLRSIFTLVPQETFLFSTTVEENIAYAADLSHEEVVTLAKIVFLDEEIDNFPNGYQTIVGEKGITLSGGQKQRISIARALAVNPEVIIFDDAFSSLDNISTSNILKNILELRKGKTTIFITHKIQITELMDRIFVMDNFSIVEEGDYEYLKENGTLFKELLEAAKEKSNEG